MNSSKHKDQEPHLSIQIGYDQGLVKSVELNPALKNGLQWSFKSTYKDSKLEACINKWFDAYCQKKIAPIQVPLDMSRFPLFTQKVLYTVSQIPFGKILTYGQVASLIGHPESARAVGGACGRNPFLLLIPCHRVLASNKTIRGFSGGELSIKQSLLQFEEADFKFVIEF